VRRVTSHIHIGEPIIPQATLTGLTEDARRLVERIGVPLPKPPKAAWGAVRLVAEEGNQVASPLS